MDIKDVINRIEFLLKEQKMPMSALMENADISTTVYQWKKNRNRDATRIPSLRSIIKICNWLGISLSYFFAIDSVEGMSVKQRETANKLLSLHEFELDAINTVIDTFLSIHNENSQEI